MLERESEKRSVESEKTSEQSGMQSGQLETASGQSEKTLEQSEKTSEQMEKTLAWTSALTLEQKSLETSLDSALNMAHPQKDHSPW